MRVSCVLFRLLFFSPILPSSLASGCRGGRYARALAGSAAPVLFFLSFFLSLFLPFFLFYSILSFLCSSFPVLFGFRPVRPFFPTQFGRFIFACVDIDPKKNSVKMSKFGTIQ